MKIKKRKEDKYGNAQKEKLFIDDFIDHYYFARYMDFIFANESERYKNAKSYWQCGYF